MGDVTVDACYAAVDTCDATRIQREDLSEEDFAAQCQEARRSCCATAACPGACDKCFYNEHTDNRTSATIRGDCLKELNSCVYDSEATYTPEDLKACTNLSQVHYCGELNGNPMGCFATDTFPVVREDPDKFYVRYHNVNDANHKLEDLGSVMVTCAGGVGYGLDCNNPTFEQILAGAHHTLNLPSSNMCCNANAIEKMIKNDPDKCDMIMKNTALVCGREAASELCANPVIADACGWTTETMGLHYEVCSNQIPAEDIIDRAEDDGNAGALAIGAGVGVAVVGAGVAGVRARNRAREAYNSTVDRLARARDSVSGGEYNPILSHNMQDPNAGVNGQEMTERTGLMTSTASAGKSDYGSTRGSMAMDFREVQSRAQAARPTRARTHSNLTTDGEEWEDLTRENLNPRARA